MSECECEYAFSLILMRSPNLKHTDFLFIYIFYANLITALAKWNIYKAYAPWAHHFTVYHMLKGFNFISNLSLFVLTIIQLNASRIIEFSAICIYIYIKCIELKRFFNECGLFVGYIYTYMITICMYLRDEILYKV